MVSGIRTPQRSITFQQNGIPSFVTSATKLLTSNLLANFDYVIDHKNAGTKDITENDSHTIDAAKCMYFGNQLSTLQSCLVSGNIILNYILRRL